jgi:Cu-Zn family superoxide dismutase
MAQFGTPGLGTRLRVGVVGIASLALGLGGGAALAQDATPVEENPMLQIVGVDGGIIGDVEVWEEEGMVSMAISVSGLEPGDHGLHIHETGVCDPAADPPFDSAGGHYNPESTTHGPGEATMVAEDGSTPHAHDHAEGTESHAGDLGNLTVSDDGTAIVTVTTSTVTMAPGAANSLADADGSALVIHADADDLTTDPSGNSGDRIGCAVIFGATTPQATPVS